MEQILVNHPWVIVLLLLWTLPWKAAALWMSARRGHLGWFLALIILNTLAILDILYIFVFSGKNIEKKQTKNGEMENRQMRMQRYRLEQEQQERILRQQILEQQLAQESRTVFEEEGVYQIQATPAAKRRQNIL